MDRIVAVHGAFESACFSFDVAVLPPLDPVKGCYVLRNVGDNSLPKRRECASTSSSRRTLLHVVTEKS